MNGWINKEKKNIIVKRENLAYIQSYRRSTYIFNSHILTNQNRNETVDSWKYTNKRCKVENFKEF